MSAADIAVHEPPRRPGEPGWDDFAASARIVSAHEIDAYGTDDVAWSPEQQLVHWHEPHTGRVLLLARREGRVVGRASIEWMDESADTGWASVTVEPAERRHGTGTRLAEAIEEEARRRGIRKVLAYAASREPALGPDGAAPARLVPPTGVGSVPADAPEVRFLLARGFRLEQVERGSRFPLPADTAALAALRATAEERASGYRVHVWEDLTPEELRDGLAELMERMSTDAPSAGLEEPAETWDAEKLLTSERHLLDAPIHLLNAAVEHVATGRLAGYTRFALPDGSTAVHQWTTIVRREDRGHRLGMLLKIANLQALAERHPGRTGVVTWNAEENRHMLDVNEAIGFVPIGHEGAWRKDLA